MRVGVIFDPELVGGSLEELVKKALIGKVAAKQAIIRQQFTGKIPGKFDARRFVEPRGRDYEREQV